MDQRGDRGLEFVLDNRRLIIAFFLLIAVCGVFFVIGFMEGKRQAVASALPPPVSEPVAQEAPAPAAEPVDAASKPPEDTSIREQLDWYKRVSKSAEPAKGLEPATEPPKAVVKEPEPARPVRSASAGVSYSVQVGAFRQRREADANAAKLKAKGYDCFIEAPASPSALFLLKVGKYSNRAEAAALQTRLKRDGFASFVKTAQ